MPATPESRSPKNPAGTTTIASSWEGAVSGPDDCGISCGGTTWKGSSPPITPPTVEPMEPPVSELPNSPPIAPPSRLPPSPPMIPPRKPAGTTTRVSSVPCAASGPADCGASVGGITWKGSSFTNGLAASPTCLPREALPSRPPVTSPMVPESPPRRSPKKPAGTSTRGPSSPRRTCAWDVTGRVVGSLVAAEPGPEDWAGISFSRSGMLVVMALLPCGWRPAWWAAGLVGDA